MQTAVVTLLLVVSATILACVVVEYAVSIFEQTLQTSNIPYVDRIRKLESFILNQTDAMLNQTLPETPQP